MESNKKTLWHYEQKKPTQLATEISLTNEEKEIFATIQSILAKNNRQDVTCRVAGGWVRDKLLHKNSSDIDIALDNMKGSEIAKMINDELFPGIKKHGVIKVNTEKGKNLETATIKICGVWIDFVNLRNDIPEQFGTPEEDALRRDTTINSLFYNINNNTIEDFTKKGIDDLMNGIIRTPIEPYLTYKDDALRILRAVRFACRYSFVISDEIYQCLNDYNEEVRGLLRDNITNNRIQKELYQIFEDNNPQSGIYFLYKMNIFDLCFRLPLNCKELFNRSDLIHKEITYSTNMILIGHYIYNTIKDSLGNISDNLFNQVNKKDLFLSLLSINYAKYKSKHNGVNMPLSQAIIKHGLDGPNCDVMHSSRLTSCVDDYSFLINSQISNRVKVGKFMLKIKYENIGILIICALASDYLKTINYDNSFEVIGFANEEQLSKVIIKHNNFIQYIYKENLLHIDEMKTLLDGNEIMTELKIKPGKHLGVLLDQLLEKQIETPDLTRGLAVEFLQKKREEFKEKV